MVSDWIDISLPIKTGMVNWPNDPAVRVERVQEMVRGDICDVSKIMMGSHTGTHIDAPAHFLRSGEGIDEIPFQTVIGLARVIEIKDSEMIKPHDLHPYKIRRGERILLKTRNSTQYGDSDTFARDFVYLSREAANIFADRNVKMVGIDYLSIGGFERDNMETHLLLLKAGIWIIEGLNLSKVSSGNYEFICLPLKIDEGDGAPARAILRAVSNVRRSNKNNKSKKST
jgi:arylformamidase